MTSDGRKKMVERYDCTGAGDVDTSIVVQANDDGNIVGVSGRLLKIPTDWTNPSGQFHIGIVNCYDLYPTNLRERIEKYRKEKLWDPGFKKVFADTMRKLQYCSSFSTNTLNGSEDDTLLDNKDKYGSQKNQSLNVK
uniref:(California timema) hypothetical protein n=1 Tax=Timema californicum TaxID=61474 RepID=A0A7R9PDT6_TIMCA|nr:unnamed protein product [Timema californicum]